LVSEFLNLFLHKGDGSLVALLSAPLPNRFSPFEDIPLAILPALHTRLHGPFFPDPVASYAILSRLANFRRFLEHQFFSGIRVWRELLFFCPVFPTIS